MPQTTIVLHEGGAAVLLPESLMESLGIHIGDALDFSVCDRQLILRPHEDAERRRALTELTRDLFEQRADAYRRLI